MEKNWYKMLEIGEMTGFDDFFLPNLGQIISGTKCDRDKPNFSREKGVSIRSGCA